MSAAARRILIAVVLLLLAHLSPLHAQPAAPNYVLSLGGTNGFLELPGGAFNDLEEATIEGWVKSLTLGAGWNPAPPFGLLNSRRDRNLPA